MEETFTRNTLPLQPNQQVTPMCKSIVLILMAVCIHAGAAFAAERITVGDYENTPLIFTGVDDRAKGIAATPRLETAFSFETESMATHRGQLYTPADAPFDDILDFDGKDVAVVKSDSRKRDLWLQKNRKTTHPQRLHPLWIIGFAAGVMGLIIAGIVFLRKQFKTHTEALKATIAEK
ncbi:MAG: hypothetical protein CR984_02565, partial [Proteobacteria bacterium]